jgi:hypothetical protein
VDTKEYGDELFIYAMALQAEQEIREREALNKEKQEDEIE